MTTPKRRKKSSRRKRNAADEITQVAYGHLRLTNHLTPKGTVIGGYVAHCDACDWSSGIFLVPMGEYTRTANDARDALRTHHIVAHKYPATKKLSPIEQLRELGPTENPII